MKYFVDIEILENPDIQTATILNSLFTPFHLALVSAGEELQIGISFPKNKAEVFVTLGNVLRLHGKESDLIEFMALRWFSKLTDYINVSKVRAVPDEVTFASIRRVQVQSNVERLRRRLRKRHNVDEETAKLRIPDSAAQLTSLPWLQIRSASTAQSFKLFIQIGKQQTTEVSGSFNRYGLSANATLPIF
jgi:CRISPR-associated endonuclease Csy4